MRCTIEPSVVYGVTSLADGLITGANSVTPRDADPEHSPVTPPTKMTYQARDCRLHRDLELQIDGEPRPLRAAILNFI